MFTSRRDWLSNFGLGFGSLALADILAAQAGAKTLTSGTKIDPFRGVMGSPHHTPKAKRVIYLFQSGGPSQLELFDPKPRLNAEHGQELPASVRQGQRLTGMSGNQSSLPLAGSAFKFQKHGKSGMDVSELLPYTAKIVDKITMIRNMYTEAINHGPGVTFMQTGSQFPGRPSIGAWLQYGLGITNENLPAFVVLVTKDKGGQPLVSRLWGSGFLPSRYQGVRFRSGKDPVLYLNNPDGIDRASRRAALDGLKELHDLQLAANPIDAAVEARIANYELAFRMQSSVPEATGTEGEDKSTLDLYGPDVSKPGTFAYNCLQARRLAERGVKFIQLYHPGWDQHGGLPGGIKRQCKETDQPSAGLILDLERRGMLEDTLVIWGGEFGRTNYCQGKLTATNYGRDHHPRCFSMWMAGGGVKAGHIHGATGEYGYNLADKGVHIHDFHATLMHLLGINHEWLTFKYQGRHFRLTDVHGHVVKDILA